MGDVCALSGAPAPILKDTTHEELPFCKLYLSLGGFRVHVLGRGYRVLAEHEWPGGATVNRHTRNRGNTYVLEIKRCLHLQTVEGRNIRMRRNELET